ncbi:outer membrane homotrimeric porin [Maridesulfovibrio frigidus]|uniref:outer membrane homotrimeric porin n=1 Tax=Maridesulfovibrio frigidus TaxID=340956 RepID=UPI0004E24BE8|nr:outer membrane homotrimeric porin [Maridesulfovibrio frigidus]
MKKLMILAILATLVLAMAGTASAVDLEAKGKFQFQANFMDNSDFLSAKNNGVQEDDLNFYFRARTQFRFIANENLMSELYVEYKTRIGTASDSSLVDSSSDRTLGIKRVFLQYRFPETEVLTTAGIFSINLPGAAAGSMVMGDLDAGALTISTPITDVIAASVGFIRAYDATSDDSGGVYSTTGSNSKDELDLFYGAVPVTIDGLEATPYFMYGLIGKDTYTAVSGRAGLTAPSAATFTKSVNSWWAGTSFGMTMFDPIVLKADFAYGDLDADQKQNDRSGWGADLSLAYTGMDFMQPKFVFAYTSGEDDKTSNGSERLPVINNDFAFGTYYYGGSALTSADLNSNQQVGQMVLGLSFEDISFLDKLTHDFHFLYIKGTNDKDLIQNNTGLTNISADGNFLTTKDQAFEIDFNTNYQIYDELAAIIEFGYIGMDLDKDTWSAYDTTRDGKEDPALKLAVGLVYEF